MKHLFLKTRLLLPLSFVAWLLVLPSLAQATPIGERSLFVGNTGNVSVTFAGSDASWKSNLYYGETFLFSNRATRGTTISLGNFEAGTELVFRLEVQKTGKIFNTGEWVYYPVENLGEGLSKIGWEDNAEGGDRDYNDLVFDLTNTKTVPGITDTSDIGNSGVIQNPEPSTILLFGSGLLGVGAWRLRKKQA
jgi:hypothetical protein